VDGCSGQEPAAALAEDDEVSDFVEVEDFSEEEPADFSEEDPADPSEEDEDEEVDVAESEELLPFTEPERESVR